MKLYETLLEKIRQILEFGNEALIIKQISFVDAKKFINYSVFSESKYNNLDKTFEGDSTDIDIHKLVNELSTTYVVNHIVTPIIYSDLGNAQIETYMNKIVGKKLKANSNPYRYDTNKILTVRKLENILTSIENKDTLVYVYPKYNVGEFEKVIFEENVSLDTDSNLRIIY